MTQAKFELKTKKIMGILHSKYIAYCAELKEATGIELDQLNMVVSDTCVFADINTVALGCNEVHFSMTNYFGKPVIQSIMDAELPEPTFLQELSTAELRKKQNLFMSHTYIALIKLYNLRLLMEAENSIKNDIHSLYITLWPDALQGFMFSESGLIKYNVDGDRSGLYYADLFINIPEEVKDNA